jgi:hypothetical protein
MTTSFRVSGRRAPSAGAARLGRRVRPTLFRKSAIGLFKDYIDPGYGKDAVVMVDRNLAQMCHEIRGLDTACDHVRLAVSAGYRCVLGGLVRAAAVQRRELLDAHLLVFHVSFEHPANGCRDFGMG